MHIPVLRNEIIENLSPQKDGVFVDMTLGGGGHSLDILTKLNAKVLVSFDVDKDAIEDFGRQLIADSFQQSELNLKLEGVQLFNNETQKVYLVNRNFGTLTTTLQELGLGLLDGIICDLGWSTDQLERIPGLSYRVDEELDMRFDQNLGVKAKDLLNALGKRELKALFSQYADIWGMEAERLVNRIMDARKLKPIETVSELMAIIENRKFTAGPAAISRGSRTFGRTQSMLPARVFQALRIAVNNELSTLQSVLPQAWEALTVGGSLQIISFHSGEDALVKDFMQQQVSAGAAVNLYRTEFLQPGVAELRENLRARSAKLRGIKKL